MQVLGGKRQGQMAACACGARTCDCSFVLDWVTSTYRRQLACGLLLVLSELERFVASSSARFEARGCSIPALNEHLANSFTTKSSETFRHLPRIQSSATEKQAFRTCPPTWALLQVR
jgi:hypothetical protein